MPVSMPLVLVVDDDRSLRELLCDALTQRGYRVACAGDGRQALDYLVLHDPDLIVSDVAMPRMHGLTLVQRVRASGGRMPIILVSGSPLPDVPPGVRFLAKPYDLDGLTAAVAAELAAAPSTLPVPAGAPAIASPRPPSGAAGEVGTPDEPWRRRVERRYGIETTQKAMIEEIRRRGWRAVITLDVDKGRARYGLRVPGMEEIVTTGATLECVMGHSLLRVPSNATPSLG